MSDLEPARLRPLLRGALGDPYLYAVETTSTQDILRDGHQPHGAVAAADHQTAGRGRAGRRWDDTPASALLFSVLLRPSETVVQQQLSLVAGLAVATALEAATGLPARVKWPNDVLIDDRKIAGILLEASGGVVVLGIGINVNQGLHDLPSGTRLPSTSLLIAAGRPFDRGAVLVAVLDELERLYDDWLASGLASIAGELDRRNALRGRRVQVSGAGGTAGEIAADGRLAVVLDAGGTVLVGSGEVELGPQLSP